MYVFYLFNIAAIQALKRKSRFQKQLQQIDGTLSAIEMQREALEDANSNMVTITAMKSASDAMKKAHQNLYVVFMTFRGNQHLFELFLGMRIKYTISWMKWRRNKKFPTKSPKQFQHQLVLVNILIIFSLEVSIIDGFLCFSGNSYDEDELERELEELEQEELDEHLLSVRTDEHTLPNVPNGDVKIPNAAAEPNKKSMSLVADLHHWSLHQWRIKNI